MKKWQRQMMTEQKASTSSAGWACCYLLPCQCVELASSSRESSHPSGVLTYLLSNYSSYFTCILRIWLPLLTKIQTVNCMPPAHVELYPVIDTEWSLSIHLWLSEYCPADCSHLQISVCLITGIAQAYLEMLLNVVLLIYVTFLFKEARNTGSWV